MNNDRCSEVDELRISRRYQKVKGVAGTGGEERDGGNERSLEVVDDRVLSDVDGLDGVPEDQGLRAILKLTQLMMMFQYRPVSNEQSRAPCQALSGKWQVASMLSGSPDKLQVTATCTVG